MKAQSAATTSEAGTVTLLKGAEKAAGLGLGDTKTLMEQQTGAVMNPYMVAAYKGPTDMREHKFTFKMMPQSAAESKTFVSIVNDHNLILYYFIFFIIFISSCKDNPTSTPPIGYEIFPSKTYVRDDATGNMIDTDIDTENDFLLAELTINKLKITT